MTDITKDASIITAIEQTITLIDRGSVNAKLISALLAECKDTIAALSRPIDPKAEVEPVLFVSEQQLASCIGTYLPTRKHREGNFQFPLYASPSIVAPVGVKPLIWEDQSDAVVTFHVTRNQIGMSYVVTVENLMTFVHSGSREVARIPALAVDEAKAAAQADYESRIRSALTPAEKADVGDGEDKRKDPWRLPDSSARFEPIAEQGNDNFATSIYEADYKGLLIARCNQNGAYPHHVTAILNGLNGKQVSAELIAKQAAEIEAIRALSTTKPAQGDGESTRLRGLIRWAHDTLYEINPSNYDHDEVCKLNDASVEVILGLAVELGEKHGKSDEWWAERATYERLKAKFETGSAALAAQGDDAQEGTR